jgi:putative membrane protein
VFAPVIIRVTPKVDPEVKVTVSISPEALAAFNTSLIVVSGVFLLLGYSFIRRRRIQAHRRSMLIATVFAGLFLVVYVTRSALFPTKHFEGQGLAYAAYLGILVPHMIAAIVVGPLALVAIARALRNNFQGHRRVTRYALPIWAFAAVTGWVIYVMLYLVSWPA